ncbi:putative cytochrome P450 [Mycobacterium kansasii 732]|nr:putative cytochrome P450 [Mycobacterium kansasii 732]
MLTHIPTMHQAARKENLTAVKFIRRMDLRRDGRHNPLRSVMSTSRATISTPGYLLDQAQRRLTPSFNNFPGMGLVERWLLNTQFPEKKLADPPPGSALKPVVGDAGCRSSGT